MKEKLGIILALAAMFQFSNLDAAPIDKELAILASEQPQDNPQPQPEEKVETPTPKTRQELEAEERRIREEKRAEEKRLREEREAARKKIEEGKREQIPISNDRDRLRSHSSEENSVTQPVDNPQDNKPLVEEKIDTTQVSKPDENLVTQESPPINDISKNPQELPLQNSSPVEKQVGLPNPIKSYSSFEEVSEAVGFTPLYIPKKSGYTINAILSIDSKVAEIRYGRRWEPEVSLAVRTYKRAPNEELQDISGINGAKWRVDDSSGSTVYLAKLNDSNHAAAWAVGDFTFSAYVENLSFAAFYALVVEELVDLSNHYYIA
ncbi:MAG: hypothetical protein IKZ58_06845 [Selenomonadaceae bacterium]|nr:hypothetical protein [Selenomonadaceae bacterium]